MNRGIEMNNISLKKVTLIVTTCVLSSYFVSAKEETVKIDEPTAVASFKTSVSNVINTDDSALAANDTLSFLTKLDSDKNGALSKAEVVESKSELLTQHFNDIDKNTDDVISKEELTDYLTALKAKS